MSPDGNAGGAMKIAHVIPQLRTTFHLKLVDTLDPSIDFVETGEHFHLYLETDDATGAAERLRANGVRLVHDTDWGTREFAVKDDQGHTVYVGERRHRA